MSKTKIIILVHVVLTVLIIAVFLPALKTDDSGYKTKTAAVAPAQDAVAEVATEDNAVIEEKVQEASSAVDTAVADVTDVTAATETAATEVQAVVESTADDVTAVVETAVTDAQVAVESTVSEAATAVESTVADVKETVTPAAAASVEGLYSVVDGNKLDANSYAGFKLFRNWCARCHGTYGQGMVGPNLADSLKIISKEQFYSTVENGKVGQIGSMPSWKANIQVMENRDQLYAYLKARSDGAIGVEKPKKQ